MNDGFRNARIKEKEGEMDGIIRTVCQGCHSECGVFVHLEGGKVSKIRGDKDHPHSRGYICVKGLNYADVLYHPDRIKGPLKRAGGKGEGKWQEIAWDQALDEIAANLTKTREVYGPDSIGSFHGTAPRASLFACRLFAAAMGTPNVVSTDLHICFAPSQVAEIATVGHSVMQEEGPDYLSAKCILVCGGNPVVSHPPRGRDLLEGIKKNNARLIVIDPRRTHLASKADVWLQIRPGTDMALILGMIHTLITEDLYDKNFVEKWCHGFDLLKEHIKSYSPEKMSEITWIPAEKIKEAARLYATVKPAAIHHRVAPEHNINSTQTDRGLIIMAAITGNLGIKGGNLLPTHVPGYIHTLPLIGRSILKSDAAERRIGSREYPLISGPEALFTFVHAGLAANAMLAGKPYPFKALYCAGGNPVVNMQNTRRTWEAFKRLDLLVVTDFFMTPTAELADYVLPATTWLEREESCDEQYMNCIVARRQAVEPLFECRDDLQIVINLAERLPWADRKHLPWDNVQEFNDFRLEGMGITFEDLKEKGYISVPLEYKQYEREGFKTPTGKVEIYSTIFQKHGYDPLPTFIEPRQSPISSPELFKEYPLILITGSRTIEYYHSAGRQISSLRNLLPDPEIEVHPDTAKKANIIDGDWVWIETPQVKGERVRLKVKLSANIDPRVVNAAHGWWFPEKPAPEHGCFDSNIDVILSDDPPREEICGSVPTRGTLCRIYKE
ncbi:molybdopterin-dependent oxidoreductase [Thermodesulfobacteriota bacterium]